MLSLNGEILDYRIEELLSNDHIIGWDEALADITNGTTR
jgi:hypothetical protein